VSNFEGLDPRSRPKARDGFVGCQAADVA